jgi:hypothetical protein
MEKKQEYVEVQKFGQWWWLLIIACVSAPLTAVLLYQLITDNSVGNNPVSNTVLVVLVCFICLPISLILYFVKLTVKINYNGIYYGFTKYPNELKWENVKAIELIKYSYPGLGYKISGEYGEIYNTGGNMGLWITQPGGSKILLGTQNPGELKSFLFAMGKL